MKKHLLFLFFFLAFYEVSLSQNTSPWPATGNVGIGTTSPGVTLTTRSGYNLLPATSGTNQTGGALRVEGGDNAVIDFGAYSVNTWIQATDKTALQLNYYLNLNPNGGNVGIGTYNPGHLLTLNNSTNSGTYLGLYNNYTADNNDWRNWLIGTNVETYGDFEIRQANVKGGNALSGGTPRFYIGNLGNVGVGSSNPQAELDLGRTLNYGELASVLARLAEGNNSGSGTFLGIRAYETQLGHGVTDWNNIKSFALEHSFYGVVNSSVNFYRGLGTTGGGISFNTCSNIEQMRITGSGNVGIGTTSPDEKLTVNGTVHASRVKVNTSIPTPDYVFKPGYKLVTLQHVQDYIEKNQHLPEIPNAAQQKKDGIDLGEMNTRLLKKVEELTLYVIREHQTNQRQSRENARLRKGLTILSNQVKRLKITATSTIID